MDIDAIVPRWSTTLRHVTDLNSAGGAGLLKLYPGLLTMLGQDMDNLQQSLQLVDSYMLLDGQNLVQVSLLRFVLVSTPFIALLHIDRRRSIL